MLNYQSTSFHDALAVRQLFGLHQAPEFAHWWASDVLWPASEITGSEQLAHERILHQLSTIVDQAKRMP